ncbi:MAG: hypothetical protein ACYDAO_10080 [Thermoplasmataceae archaeon]
MGDQGRQGKVVVTADDIALLPDIIKMLQEDGKSIQELYEYAEENYNEECMNSADECPDYLDLPDILLYKQVYTWFIYEKVIPSTGKTVVDEFVSKFFDNTDYPVAQRLLLGKESIRGVFIVRNSSHFPLVILEHKDSSTEYLAISKTGDSKEARKLFENNHVILAKIHPYLNNRYYVLDGIITELRSVSEVRKSPFMMFNPDMLLEGYEKTEIKKFESILLKNQTTLQSAMNKYPSFWVDGMCKAIGIDTKRVTNKREKIREVISRLVSGHAEDILKNKFGDAQKQILSIVLGDGGISKFGKLSRQFSSELRLFWVEDPPKSDIGILRLHGFLIVGKMADKGRMNKVALIPIELREIVANFLSERSESA